MDSVFEKYYAEIRKQAVLKSAIYAVAAAFIAVAVAGLIFWFVGFEHVWLLAVVAVVAFAAAVPALYFLLFRPTKRDAAKRMDRELGLEERMLTMVELEYSKSPIAYLQKANTESALASASTKALTFAATAALAIVLPIAVLVGAAGTTVSALEANGIIPSGVSLISAAMEGEPTTFTLKYLIAEGGELVGEEEQVVENGGDASTVIAVPHLSGENGQWVFIGWSDGVSTPARTDKNVSQNKTLTAKFSPVEALPDFDNVIYIIEDSDLYLINPDADKDKDGNPDGPRDPDAPKDKDSEGDSDGEGGGEGGDAGGKNSDFNQVIDGNTYYGESTFNEYYSDASEELSNNGEMPEDLKDGINKYYETIKK